MTEPRMPAGLAAGGQRLWRSVLDDYDLAEFELALLVEASRTVDVLARLDVVIRREGPLVASPQGQKAHPAATEARQQKIALARLLAALRLPAGEPGDHQGSARPQRRAGARGTYGIRGAVS